MLSNRAQPLRRCRGIKIDDIVVAQIGKVSRAPAVNRPRHQLSDQSEGRVFSSASASDLTFHAANALSRQFSISVTVLPSKSAISATVLCREIHRRHVRSNGDNVQFSIAKTVLSCATVGGLAMQVLNHPQTLIVVVTSCGQPSLSGLAGGRTALQLALRRGSSRIFNAKITPQTNQPFAAGSPQTAPFERRRPRGLCHWGVWLLTPGFREETAQAGSVPSA